MKDMGKLQYFLGISDHSSSPRSEKSTHPNLPTRLHEHYHTITHITVHGFPFLLLDNVSKSLESSVYPA